jgi:hypothetical protein
MRSPNYLQKDSRRAIGAAYARTEDISTRHAIRRRVPYPGSGGIVYVPQPIWEETLEWIRHYGRHASEGLVFWGGVTDGIGSATVTCLVAPNHAAMGGTVKLLPELSRALVRSHRHLDLKLLAQVHSHDGKWVDHSAGDDEHAASFHDGFLSLVVPDFGSGVTRPNECGVHEFRRDLGRFERLVNAEIQRRLHLEPMFVVLQDGPAPSEPQVKEKDPWYRRWLNGWRRRPSTSGSRKPSAGSSAPRKAG